MDEHIFTAIAALGEQIAARDKKIKELESSLSWQETVNEMAEKELNQLKERSKNVSAQSI